MKIAYSYGRFSQLSQDLGHSRKRQADSAAKWCAANGYTLSDRTFFDKAKSGYYGENFKEDGALRQFIDLHANGEIERDAILLIDSADRFSRLPINISVHHFLSVVNAGIGLVFTGSYDKRIITADLIAKEEYLLHAIIAELKRAHAESEEKSRKVKESLDVKKAEMQAGVVLKHNNVPQYFEFVPKERHGKGWRGVYVKHPEKSKIVLEIVQGILAGKSLYGMALDLNNRHVPAIKGRVQWHRNSVRQILRSRTLIGEYLGVPNYVEAIIDETTFLQVQNVLNNNKKNRGKKATLANIFRGICFCAECDKAMTVHSGAYKGVTYRYLRCSNYGTRGACVKAYMPLDDIEYEFFDKFLSNPFRLINPDDVSQLKDVRANIETKIARQSQVKQEIDKLLELMQTVSLDELSKRLALLSKERDTIKTELDSLMALAASIDDFPKKVAKGFKELALWKFGENADKTVIDKHVAAEVEKARVSQIKFFLQDNESREQFKAVLPNIIGKVVIDSKQRRFFVYNYSGRLVYESSVFKSQNNNTDRWRESLKVLTHRKTAGGRLIECKRKVRPSKKQDVSVETVSNEPSMNYEDVLGYLSSNSND